MAACFLFLYHAGIASLLMSCFCLACDESHEKRDIGIAFPATAATHLCETFALKSTFNKPYFIWFHSNFGTSLIWWFSTPTISVTKILPLFHIFLGSKPQIWYSLRNNSKIFMDCPMHLKIGVQLYWNKYFNISDVFFSRFLGKVYFGGKSSNVSVFWEISINSLWIVQCT